VAARILNAAVRPTPGQTSFVGHGSPYGAGAEFRKGGGIRAYVTVGRAVNGSLDAAAGHKGDKRLGQAEFDLVETSTARAPEVGVPARERESSSLEEGGEAVAQTVLVEGYGRHLSRQTGAR